MTSLVSKIAIALLLGAAYIAAPFVTAWSIREAVRTNNSDVLAASIEWPSVRETLKPAIARIALNLPDTSASEKPSLWTRIKTYWGKGTVDSLVETYVTPEGLPKLFTLRKAYRDWVSSDADETKSLSLPDRIERAWSRVRRAEFTSLTSFEIDMEDNYDPTRLYLGKLQLMGFGWKLTELRVKFLTTANSAAQKLVDFN